MSSFAIAQAKTISFSVLNNKFQTTEEKSIISVKTGPIGPNYQNNELSSNSSDSDTPDVTERTSSVSNISHSKWHVLRVIIQLASLANNPVVHSVSVDAIMQEIEEFEPRQRTESVIFDKITIPSLNTDRAASACHEMFSDSVKRVQNEQKLLYLFQVGDEEAIKEIEDICQNDPAFYYDDDDPRRLINFPDEYHRTGLYIACEHGNLRLVNSLLELRCDIYFPALIDDDSEETPLECASRWGYINIVKRIMKHITDLSTPKVLQMIRKAKYATSHKNCQQFLRYFTRKYKKTTLFNCTSPPMN